MHNIQFGTCCLTAPFNVQYALEKPVNDEEEEEDEDDDDGFGASRRKEEEEDDDPIIRKLNVVFCTLTY